MPETATEVKAAAEAGAAEIAVHVNAAGGPDGGADAGSQPTGPASR